MGKKYFESSVIIRQEEIGIDIYEMWLSAPDIASEASPGQFISIYSSDGSRILPRPISICEINDEKNAIKVVYRVAGKGTDEFSKLKSGNVLKITGPLGNGYTLRNNSAMLIGGGIGVPPLVELAKSLKKSGVNRITAVLGYRTELYLKDRMSELCEVYVATEDGSFGIKGNVMDVINQKELSADTIYACGPKPMLKAISEFAEKNNIEAQISLEERMACGIGACLGCVCKTKKKNDHSHVNNARVCVDGPVFDSREVDL